jgi:restriction system protein
MRNRIDSAPMWQLEIKHEGLHKYRIVKGETQEILRIRAQMQLHAWNEQWERVCAIEAKRKDRESKAYLKENKRQLAQERSGEAQQKLEALDQLLLAGIELDHTIDWSRLKDTSSFPTPLPGEPALQGPPDEPRFDEPQFALQLGLIAKLIPSIRQKEEAKWREKFLIAHNEWGRQKSQCDQANQGKKDAFKRQSQEWEKAREKWVEAQTARNAVVDTAQADYLAGKKESLIEYCEMVLHSSEYPENFPAEAVLDYLQETRTLVVDYALPDTVALPTLKEVKFVAARNDTQEVHTSEAWINRTYDVVLYQITLRCLYELFQADEISAIDSIIFNGWVTSTDKSTGKQVTACIMSIQVNKSEFMDINLSQVDPKACFKKLKGVAAAKLIALQPVRPILSLNKEDKRFISSYEVAASLDNSSNLAAMDWEDFEQLIREIFEKEFSANGGEVKITQASRDGGVDAVAFDPDPIRGGKIVVQAKRYTHTVGVSAVRDLYGTVHNEGANKGILVTTADYGPDAYEFAKGKPLTLLSGSELLYLLQKHGHRAHINLQEARLQNAEKEKARRATNSQS